MKSKDNQTKIVLLIKINSYIKSTFIFFFPYFLLCKCKSSTDAIKVKHYFHIEKLK